MNEKWETSSLKWLHEARAEILKEEKNLTFQQIKEKRNQEIKELLKTLKVHAA